MNVEDSIIVKNGYIYKYLQNASESISEHPFFPKFSGGEGGACPQIPLVRVKHAIHVITKVWSSPPKLKTLYEPLV